MKKNIQQITNIRPYATVHNAEKFRLHCCGCGMIHDVIISAYGLTRGTNLRIKMKINNRAKKLK